MKIAVCIFGQPRFYKEASQSFCEEFLDMPNHEVDVFIHCWSEIGYTPKDDINNTNEKFNSKELKNEIWNLYGGPEGAIKQIKIESPEEKFNHLADSLSEVIGKIRDDKYYEEIDWRKDLGRKKAKGIPDDVTDCCSIRIGNGRVLRYEMGQFYSIDKVITLKAWHEKENNFEYDLVVRVRTDSFYVPKEIYSNNITQYYEDKEKYYSSLHRYYNGAGVMGHGLKIVCGIGNGAHAPKGKQDTGFFTKLEYIEFKENKVIKIKNRLWENKPEIIENITDINGMFNFPWKVHLKDWILIADSQTANDIWGGMTSTYMAFIFNDLIRFLGEKQTGFMPGGEVLNGLACLLGNAKAINIPTNNDDLRSNERRVLKIVNRDTSKRKPPFKPKNGEKDWQVPMGGGAMPCGEHGDMIESIMDFVQSERDKGNCLCSIYRKSKE